MDALLRLMLVRKGAKMDGLPYPELTYELPYGK